MKLFKYVILPFTIAAATGLILALLKETFGFENTVMMALAAISTSLIVNDR